MQFALVLYPHFTMLDIIGPFQVVGDIPEAEIDRLFGRERAELLHLAIEYDAQPPFDAGSPAKASTEIVDVARAVLADTLSDEVVADVVAEVGS